MSRALTFYAGIVRRAVGILFTSSDAILTVCGIGLFFVMVFNPELADQITRYAGAQWKRVLNFSRWWALLVPSVLFIYALARANYRTILELEARVSREDRQRTEAHRRQVLWDRLGSSLREARPLFTNPAVGDVEAWATRTHALILRGLGAAEAELFLSDAGYVFHVSQRDTAAKTWLDGRYRRLSDLIARSGSLTVRDDFDPRIDG